MTDLINRLENAVGADRELDKQIWQLLVPDVTRRTIHVAHHSKPYDIDETRDASGRLIIVPSYTVSLDAALALVAEVLPGASVQMHIVSGVIGSAEIGFNRKVWKGRHKSPAIALIIALLQAQGAQE